MKQYKYKGRLYSIVNCKVEDIPSHVERVSSYWDTNQVDVTQQIKYLTQCIQSGLAKKLIDDKGRLQVVIYCMHIRDTEVSSHLLWARSKKLLAIMSWYLREHQDIAVIYFTPHSKDFIPFEFIVAPHSIRSFHSHDTPLMIDLFSETSREFGYSLIRDGIVEEL